MLPGESFIRDQETIIWQSRNKKSKVNFLVRSLHPGNCVLRPGFINRGYVATNCQEDARHVDRMLELEGTLESPFSNVHCQHTKSCLLQAPQLAGQVGKSRIHPKAWSKLLAAQDRASLSKPLLVHREGYQDRFLYPARWGCMAQAELYAAPGSASGIDHTVSSAPWGAYPVGSHPQTPPEECSPGLPMGQRSTISIRE